jgi:hypothetical protein
MIEVAKYLVCKSQNISVLQRLNTYIHTYWENSTKGNGKRQLQLLSVHIYIYIYIVHTGSFFLCPYFRFFLLRNIVSSCTPEHFLLGTFLWQLWGSIHFLSVHIYIHTCIYCTLTHTHTLLPPSEYRQFLHSLKPPPWHIPLTIMRIHSLSLCAYIHTWFFLSMCIYTNIHTYIVHYTHTNVDSFSASTSGSSPLETCTGSCLGSCTHIHIYAYIYAFTRECIYRRLSDALTSCRHIPVTIHGIHSFSLCAYIHTFILHNTNTHKFILS